MNIPTLLTFSRIFLLIPIIMLLYMVESWTIWLAFGLYVVAGFTDFLDGYIARKYNQITDFGTFLDPISDKIVVGALLLAFAATGRLEGIWLLPALLILAREFFISGLREYLGPKNIKLPVSKLGKWKTTTQMLALGLLILSPIHAVFLWGGHIILTISAFITVLSGWDYFKAAGFLDKREQN